MVRSFSNRREAATSFYFLIAGGLAGVTYHLLTYPIDTVKTNFQSGVGFKESVSKALEISKLKGYKVVLLRAALVNSCSFLVYEKAQEYVAAFREPYYAVC